MHGQNHIKLIFTLYAGEAKAKIPKLNYSSGSTHL